MGVLAAAGLGLAGLTAHAQMSGVEKLRAAQTEFRVCAAPDNMPFTSRSGAGFDDRIARLLAAAEGKKLTYSWWTAPRGLVSQRLDRWDCDVVMGVPTGYGPTATTIPYYCSTYVEVSRAEPKRPAAGLVDTALPQRIGVLLETPPLDLLLRRHIHPRVYLPSQNTGANASQIVDDVASGRLDVGFVWGPVGGYFAAHARVPLRVTPVTAAADPTLRMVFPVSIGVRHGDQARLAQLNALIRQHGAEIRAILHSYGVPTVEHSRQCGGPVLEPVGFLRTADAQPSTPPGATPGGAPAGISCTGIKTLADVAKLGNQRAPGKPYTARGGKVDEATYIGWTRFAAFCERCHGPGGSGSAIAPDLTAAIKSLNKRQFETVVTCGVKGNLGAGVMPAWGNNPNIEPYLDKLWSYLVARSDGALGAGRPEKLQGGH